MMCFESQLAAHATSHGERPLSELRYQCMRSRAIDEDQGDSPENDL